MSSQYVLNNAYRLPASLAEYCADDIHRAMVAESRRMRLPDWARDINPEQRSAYAKKCRQRVDDSKVARAKDLYLPHVTHDWQNARQISEAVGCDHATCLRFLKLLADLELIEMRRNSNKHAFWRLPQ